MNGQQRINSILPDKPVNGGSVVRDTLAGRKSQFTRESSLGSVSFTIGAGGNVGVDGNLQLWNQELPLISQIPANIVRSTDCIAWPFLKVYIDADLDPNSLLGSDTLTSGQRMVGFTTMPLIDPTVYSTPYNNSATTRFVFFNPDGSSHVVYFYIGYKYIIFGDSNL